MAFRYVVRKRSTVSLHSSYEKIVADICPPCINHVDVGAKQSYTFKWKCTHRQTGLVPHQFDNLQEVSSLFSQDVMSVRLSDWSAPNYSESWMQRLLFYVMRSYCCKGTKVRYTISYSAARPQLFLNIIVLYEVTGIFSDSCLKFGYKSLTNINS